MRGKANDMLPEAWCQPVAMACPLGAMGAMGAMGALGLWLGALHHLPGGFG